MVAGTAEVRKSLGMRVRRGGEFGRPATKTAICFADRLHVSAVRSKVTFVKTLATQAEPSSTTLESFPRRAIASFGQ